MLPITIISDRRDVYLSELEKIYKALGYGTSLRLRHKQLFIYEKGYKELNRKPELELIRW